MLKVDVGGDGPVKPTKSPQSKPLKPKKKK